MRIIGINTRISGPGFVPVTNWRVTDKDKGSRRRPITGATVSGSSVKTFLDLANASTKTAIGLTNASTKAWAGLTNV